MKKYMLLSIVYTLNIMKAYSTEYLNNLTNDQGDITNKTSSSQSESNDPVSAQVLSNFRQNKSLIENHLASVEEAQLHFFWTRGYTFSDNPNYHPHKTVNIGGTEYKDKFFSYVDQLLHNSPHKLIVKLVLDDMTMASNKSSIEQLQNLYTNRFQITFIDNVEKKILNHFTDSAQTTKKINAIFKNATAGIPVLASDIYRVVGMMYGHNQSFDPNKVLYTYSDVDAFCFGMETEHQSNKDLIKSLFASELDTNSGFYFGRKYTNNDIIKIKIQKETDYKEFCKGILDKIEIKNSVVEHFVKLQDLIRNCEGKNTVEIDIKKLVPRRIDDLINAVTQTTGPLFIVNKNIKMDLEYPSITAGAWYAPEDILNYRNARSDFVNPSNVFVWSPVSSKPEQKSIAQKYREECDGYLNLISAAFYAKPFGINHPFNIALTKQLKVSYPYHSEIFTTMLKMSFQEMNQKNDVYYELISLDDLSKKERERMNMYVNKHGNIEKKCNEVYLTKLSDKELKFTLTAADGQNIEGTIELDKDVKGDYEIINLFKHRFKILHKLKEKGYSLQPKPGLNYDDWKTQSIKRLYNGMNS